MIPTTIADVLEGLATAQNIYKIAFRDASNTTTDQSYKEFGEDIRKLAINLDLLSDVLQRAQYQAGSLSKARQYPGSVLDYQILGDFRGTLSECDHLLNDQHYFPRSGGFVKNLCWYAHIDPEVQKLRERVICHNIKLSVVFSILHPQVLEDRSFHIVDETAFILDCAKNVGLSAHEEEGSSAPLDRRIGYIPIPRELEDGFTRITRQVNPDLFTLDRGIDASILYFNRLTMTSSQVVQSDVAYHVAVIDVMMATWLLKTARGSRQYQVAARSPTIDAFARQMEYWGMTIARFFDHFEESLQATLRYLLGRHMILPPTPDLLAIFENQNPIGRQSQRQHIEQLQQGEQSQLNQRGAIEIEDTSVTNREAEGGQHGVKEMEAFLKSQDPDYTQTLKVYKQTETHSSLVLVDIPLSQGREKETTYNYELDQVQIIPSYAMRTWTAPSLEPQCINFRSNHISPLSRTLVFHQNKDMFEFQQKLTGYRVVHDESRVLATLQESKFLSGSNRQDLGRLQIWSAPPLKEDLSIPSARSSTAFTSNDSNRMSQASSAGGSNSGRHSKKKSTPSIFSSTSRSSSRTSVAVHPPSYMGTSSSRKVFYLAPISPCIVLFAHKAPTLSARVEGRDLTRSFLVIEIGPEITAEEETNEVEEQPSHRCVIERKSSYLQARRSVETSDPDLWNVAAIGIYQRDTKTEALKRLKHVILQFDNRNNLTNFITKFNQVKAIATMRLADFIKATGGRK